MHVVKGRVAEVAFKSAQVAGGKITPEVLVLHDTAGRLEKGS